jgi:hypothetical protein
MKLTTLRTGGVWLVVFVIAILMHWLNGDNLLVRGPVLVKAITVSGMCAFLAAFFYWLIFDLEG